VSSKGVSSLYLISFGECGLCVEYLVYCYVGLFIFFHSSTHFVTFIFGTTKILRTPSIIVRPFNAFSMFAFFPILINPRPPSLEISMKHSTVSTVYSRLTSHAGGSSRTAESCSFNIDDSGNSAMRSVCEDNG
jgi:hypothetical protein